MDRKAYAAPVLVERGPLTARTLQFAMGLVPEELDPDLWRPSASL
jgi:hypothetical protein